MPKTRLMYSEGVATTEGIISSSEAVETLSKNSCADEGIYGTNQKNTSQKFFNINQGSPRMKILPTPKAIQPGFSFNIVASPISNNSQ